MFINVHTTETRTGTSFTNELELSKVLHVLKRLLRCDVHKEESIAVITPYKAQARLFQRRIRDDPGINKLLAGIYVEVNTIDGFQGRERDIILFSTVRSNGSSTQGDRRNGRNARSNHQIGFVADERRLNVAITRARKALLIFGNENTLSVDSIWCAMMASLRERRFVYNDLPPSLA
jgi:senataxin